MVSRRWSAILFQFLEEMLLSTLPFASNWKIFMSDSIRTIEPTEAYQAKQQIKTLEQQIQAARGILIAVVAGLEAQALDTSDAKDALNGAITLLGD